MGALGAVNVRNKVILPGGAATVGRGPRTGTPLAPRLGARHAYSRSGRAMARGPRCSMHGRCSMHDRAPPDMVPFRARAAGL